MIKLHPPIFADVKPILNWLSSHGLKPTGAIEDSRKVRPGDVFLAYPGDFADGRTYIPDAIRRGAVAVIWQTGGDFAWQPEWQVPNLPVDALRLASGPLSHALQSYPCERLSLLAVTGTNGKTTISQWIAQSLSKPCAIIGTLGAGVLGDLIETGFTTPEAGTLSRYLADFIAQGVHACALEASSIGVEEHRLDGARFDTVIFTNLTRDHLDYHGSMESYAAAKAKLFQWPRLRLAIVNLDDAFGRELCASTSASKLIGYSLNEVRDAAFPVVFAEAIEDTPVGMRFKLRVPNGSTTVEARLLGRYNLSNLLAVAAFLFDQGLSAGEIGEVLSELRPPAGRLEVVSAESEPLVAVDYAHTPDALQNALVALRCAAHARGGRLVVLFGCGGNRDHGKRVLMGEVAERFADRVVLTSDNPRRENPNEIISEIYAGAPSAEIEADRGAAIRKVISTVQSQDVVLLAGKGHEPYQEIMGEKRPFSDVIEARAALAARRETN